MVVLGRPKGKRGSYQQWQEDNVTPQVAFEVLSPGNRSKQMLEKLLFYQRYGVQEYYIYDPERNELAGFVRSEDWLEPIEKINGWISPLLQIRFELTENNLEIYRPDGRRFLSPVELEQRAEDAIAQLKKEQQLYQDLLAKLRDRGIDPEQL
jgi:hypothetical protein